MKAKAHFSTQDFSRRERGKILIDGLISFLVVMFLYFGAVLLYRELIDRPFVWLDTTASLRQRLDISRSTSFVLLYITGFGAMLLAVILTNWRVRRRIRQVQLAHILDELKYIAKGNYDHRISDVGGSMRDVIESINHLVDSTVEAMEEERRIEKTKDELIANVGHDIRTPLTSIIGYLGLIENQQYSSLEEVIAYAHIAYTKATSMQKMINDLFDYTILRQTTYHLDTQEVRVDLFLEQLVADFELEASQKGIQLQVEVIPQLYATFDVEQMARVFHNLISNALKYGTGATKIIVVAEKNTSDFATKMLKFEVRNNGALLEEHELERIFERSYRIDRARTFAQQGSGLGLAIVRNIIELHQGKVYAHVEQDELVFTMELPQ